MRMSQFVSASALVTLLFCQQSHAQTTPPALTAGKYTISLSSIVPSTTSQPRCPFNYESTDLTSAGLTIAGSLQYPGAGGSGGVLYLYETNVGSTSGGSILEGAYTKLSLPPVPAGGPAVWSGDYTLNFVMTRPWAGSGVIAHSTSTGSGKITLHITAIDADFFYGYATAAPGSGGGSCSALLTGALSD